MNPYKIWLVSVALFVSETVAFQKGQDEKKADTAKIEATAKSPSDHGGIANIKEHLAKVDWSAENGTSARELAMLERINGPRSRKLDANFHVTGSKSSLMELGALSTSMFDCSQCLEDCGKAGTHSFCAKFCQKESDEQCVHNSAEVTRKVTWSEHIAEWTSKIEESSRAVTVFERQLHQKTTFLSKALVRIQYLEEEDDHINRMIEECSKADSKDITQSHIDSFKRVLEDEASAAVSGSSHEGLSAKVGQRILALLQALKNAEETHLAIAQEHAQVQEASRQREEELNTMHARAKEQEAEANAIVVASLETATRKIELLEEAIRTKDEAIAELETSRAREAEDCTIQVVELTTNLQQAREKNAEYEIRVETLLGDIAQDRRQIESLDGELVGKTEQVRELTSEKIELEKKQLELETKNTEGNAAAELAKKQCQNQATDLLYLFHVAAQKVTEAAIAARAQVVEEAGESGGLAGLQLDDAEALDGAKQRICK